MMNGQSPHEMRPDEQPPDGVQESLTPEENHPPGLHPDTGSIPPEEGLEPTQPAGKFKLTWGFAAGFLGWYLVTALIYQQIMDAESLAICGGVLFLVNLVVLFLLLRFQRQIGWGMLTALGLNMVVSLFLGLWQNALCFLPFYTTR